MLCEAEVKKDYLPQPGFNSGHDFFNWRFRTSHRAVDFFHELKLLFIIRRGYDCAVALPLSISSSLGIINEFQAPTFSYEQPFASYLSAAVNRFCSNCLDFMLRCTNLVLCSLPLAQTCNLRIIFPTYEPLHLGDLLRKLRLANESDRCPLNIRPSSLNSGARTIVPYVSLRF